MTTREEAISWLKANRYILTSSIKFTPEQIKYFFASYNLITGESKPVVGCGRCILNMKQRLRAEFEKIENAMTTYTVYLTAKGTYTFKETGKPVAYIRAANETAAKEQLEIMKKQTKTNVQ